MEEEILQVSHQATKHDRKFGNDFNGTYMGRRVTIVMEDYEQVVERLIDEYHVLRYICHASGGHTIKDSYACTLGEFLKVKKEKYDINLIACTEDERIVLNNTNLLHENWKTNGYRYTQDAVNILRDVVEAIAELRIHDLKHGDLTADNIVLCVVQGRIRAKVTRLKRPTKTDYTDYHSLSGLIEGLFCSPEENGYICMSNEPEDLWYHINQWTMSGSNVDQVEWQKQQEHAVRIFFGNPRILFKQLIFWPDEMCLLFIFKIRWVFERCHETHYFRLPQIQSFLKDIEAIGQAGWFRKLQNDTAVYAELFEDLAQKIAIYKNTKTEDLLRFIRNMFSHFEEKQTAFKVAVGELPHGFFFEFFRSRYPNLFLETRRVLLLHFEELQNYGDIDYAFEGYI